MRNEQTLKLQHSHILSQNELASFMLLYAPLLSDKSIQLFLLMESLLNAHLKIRNTRFICETLSITPIEFTQYRKELEKYMLIKTYESESKGLLIVLQPVMSGKQFLTHEVMGRFYLSKMGTKCFDFVKTAYANQSIEAEYQEISEVFKTQAFDNWKQQDEEIFQDFKTSLPTVKGNFNMELFLASCTQLKFPESERNQENLALIEDLGNLYHILERDMVGFVGRSMNLKTNTLNQDKLRKLIRSQIQLPENTDPYDLTPAQFLTYKQNGIKPGQADLRLLEDLMTNFKLPAKVVNVLVEYVLEITDMKLDRAYVEKIASVWVRKNIDTYEKAVEMTQEKPKKTKKTGSENKRKLPEWYGNEEEEIHPASKEAVDEFNELLKKLG